MNGHEMARARFWAALTRMIALGTLLLPILLAACDGGDGGGGGGGGGPGY